MAEKFDTFLVKRDGKWLHVKEKWVDGQEVARPALQAKGYETGTAMRDAKDRWVNVPDSQVEKAMEMGLHIPSAGSPTQKTQEDFKAEREAKQAAEPQPYAQTVVDNVVDSMQFNQLPNTEGALRTAGQFLAGDMNVSDNFAKNRQAVIDRLAKGREDHPVVANATAMAADFANPINPLGKFKGAAKAINGLAKYGKILPTLVKQGGEAAFRSLGHAGDGEEVLTDAALGGALGSIGDGLTSDWVKKRLQNQKIQSTLKHFGNQKSLVKRLGDKNLEEAAEVALQKGLVNPGEDAAETLALAELARQASGEELGKVHDALRGAGMRADPQPIVKDITKGDLFDPDILYGGPSFDGDRKNAEDLMKSLFPRGGQEKLSFDDLILMRKKASAKSAWDKGRMQGTNNNDNRARQAYHALNDAIEREGNAMGGGLGEAFRAANDDYRATKDLVRLAEHKVQRDMGNNALGLRASILGGTIGLGKLSELDPTGGLVSSGVSALGVNELLRRGPGAFANVAHKIQGNYGKKKGYLLGKTQGGGVRGIFDSARNRVIQGQDEEDKEAAINRHLAQ